MKSTKTILLLTFIFFIINLDANAQFGFKGGINLPNVTAKNKYNNFKIDPENKIGFNAGIFLDIAKIEGIQLTSNLTYSKKMISGNYGFTQLVVTYGTDLSVDYLIYSLSGKYNFLERRSQINPFIYFAPRLNIYLSSAATESDSKVPHSVQDIISDKLTKFGFGVSIGAGIDIETETKVMPFVEVQFSPDFFNAYDDGYLSFKSNSVEALVGIRFK